MDETGAFHVVEHFISINGEGHLAGQLALFIRFAGCNLACEYCDTTWANEKDVPYESYTVESLLAMVQDAGVTNITLTGGEPLLQKKMKSLLAALRQRKQYRIEIETNGSVDIGAFMPEEEMDNVTFTLDYKTSVSGMEDKMFLENYQKIRTQDTVKFVVGSIADMEKGVTIIRKYGLVEKGCGIYFSPCFGEIAPADMVDFLVKNRLNGVNVQLQLHKFIWDVNQRGV